MTSAHLSAILSFSLWGLFPIFWKVFSDLKSTELVAHRILWSFITLILILFLKKRMQFFKEIWLDRKKRYFLALSALMISTNWVLYIHAVNNGQILEASLGYFLNPILNILIGSIFLKEKIRTLQWPSIILVFISIIYIVLQTDLTHIPWIAISLSLSFALYSLIRKIIHVGSLEGLAYETSLMILPILIWWSFDDSSPISFINQLPHWKIFLLTLSGLITSIPLILFAYGAKRLDLSTLGFIQYLSPSFKFLCGLVIFHEPLSITRLQAFIIIWIALGLYSIESVLHHKKLKATFHA